MSIAKRIVTDTTRPFWDGIAQGRLMLQRDPRTGRCQFYPRALSLWTEGPLEWIEASGEGELVAFTLTHFPAPGFIDQLPYLQGLIRLDEGPRVFANLSGAALGELRVGQRMRVAFDGGDGAPFTFRPLGAPTKGP
ncbi:OB-fold domain-containing protein [uncultured Hydrogenophaga sp.]|uniref:Zn-ribbon domain-containing OB-fold protein n=1 Tax=uncultured Hydrogenophaga sp. TaxID=199683 RepID=UPI002587D836|nr:OB-fold domain-containing protein [uncultured Hydrogenophaga sp.]